MSRVAQPARLLAVKVPEVTALFWATKIVTTALGEAVSDYLAAAFDPALAVAATFVVFGVVLVIQLLARRYHPWLYWSAVTMVAIFGTMAADVLHVGLGVPYAVTTVGFAVILAAVLLAWRLAMGTLSIHTVRTRPRELFYWATVSATFALGTAAGDLTATVLHLGYLGAGLAFAVVICVPWAGYRLFHWNEVGSFWFAYVVTRPLGASFADWLGAPRGMAGALGLGHGPVALGLLVIVAVLVAVAQLQHSRAIGARARVLGDAAA